MAERNGVRRATEGVQRQMRGGGRVGKGVRDIRRKKGKEEEGAAGAGGGACGGGCLC